MSITGDIDFKYFINRQNGMFTSKMHDFSLQLNYLKRVYFNYFFSQLQRALRESVTSKQWNLCKQQLLAISNV